MKKIPAAVASKLDKYVPAHALASMAEAIQLAIADAWDEGYVHADNGGSEDTNPYRA